MKVSIITCLISLTLLPLAGCKSGRGAVPQAESQEAIKPMQINRVGNQGVYPDATIFKMSGNYADNVAVTLNADGTLLYYPAPSDITEASAPYPLGNGWYLNRQGISEGSVFTKWTFKEYMEMAEPPTQAMIKEAIIPGARVTAIKAIPVKIGEAIANPSICIKYAE